MRTYRDFVLLTQDADFDGSGNLRSFSVLVFDSPAGQGERKETVEVPDYVRLTTWSRQLAQRRFDADLARQIELGSRLADLLLPPYARGLFERSLAAVGDGGLRLRLRLLEVLAPLPWEILYLLQGGGEPTPAGFLALDPRISIARHEAIAISPDWAKAGDRRRIVVAMATPPPYQDYRRLDHLPEEQRKIKQALDPMKQFLDVEYVPVYDSTADEEALPSASLEEVSSALLPFTDIFHFSGHGDYAEEMGEIRGTLEGKGLLILEDGESRQAVAIPAERVAEVIRGRGVRLVTLGACETARRDRYQVRSSVVTALLQGRIPCVVAMQFTILDDLAAAFVADFYEALADGRTIDEAISHGRQAMRVKAVGQRLHARDWAAPVLYSRVQHPFPPIGDVGARQRIQQRLEQRTRLHETWWEWMSRGATASASQLQGLAAEGESLELSPVQTLILLRSAVACDEPAQPWLDRLRQEGKELVAQLVAPGAEDASISAEAAQLLGLDEPTAQVDRVSRSAVSHPDPVTRHTAALALTALEPSPHEGLERIDGALGELRGRERWWRHAELRGMLADADPEIEALNTGQPPWDRFGVWFWRFRRRLIDDSSHIRTLIIGAALGAGLALGLFRGLLGLRAGPGTRTLAAVSLFWGGLLGAAVGLGMGLAHPLLLERRWQERERVAGSWRSSLLAIVLGTVLFGIAHALTAWFNLLQFSDKALLLATGVIVGLGVNLALCGLPRADLRPSILGWLARLGTTGVVAFLAQWIVFATGREHEAMAISRTARAYEFYYFNWSRSLLDLARNFPRCVAYADVAVVGMLFTAGISIGVSATRRWFAKLTTTPEQPLRGRSPQQAME
jgi:hypothetical protein